MKKINIIYSLLVLVLAFSACEIEPIIDPNNPAAEGVQDGASIADLRLLAAGSESAMRNDIEFYYWTTSIVGRDYYDLNGIDPRYTGELVGEQGAELDNNGFLTTRVYNSRYRAIRNVETLIQAVDKAVGLSDMDKNGFLGYAETIKAYNLLLVLNQQYENGIRVDVSDPDNLGDFLEYNDASSAIKSLLDDALTALNAAGESFAFKLSDGFAGFNIPADFAKFNRALAARLALYQGNNAEVLSLLEQSFFDRSGNWDGGVYHLFGSGGNDILNDLYNIPNEGLYTATPDWVDNAEEGDSRFESKVTMLEASDDLAVPVMLAGLSGEYQVTLYDSNTDKVPVIRNEELMLMFIEANIGTNNGEAEAAINELRASYGLEPVSDLSETELVNQLIHERRYSLFGEGHRWLDMRRWGKLNEIKVDREGDVVHAQFPRPITEN